MKKSPHNIKVVPLSIIYTGVVFIIVLILLLFNAENLVTGNFDIGKWISSSKEPINVYEMLVKRDGTYVTKDLESKPYSGPVYALHTNGLQQMEGTLKDGKWDGKWSSWNRKGELAVEGNFIEGKKDGIWYGYDEYYKRTSDNNSTWESWEKGKRLEWNTFHGPPKYPFIIR